MQPLLSNNTNERSIMTSLVAATAAVSKKVMENSCVTADWCSLHGDSASLGLVER